MSVGYDYSAWDGSQGLADLDPDELLAGLTDDLLAGGDLDDALRRLLRGGFRSGDGEEVPGLRDLLERLRRRRAEMLAEGDPDGRLAQLAQQLDRIEQTEREAIDDLVADAHQSGDERRVEVTHGTARSPLSENELAEKVRECFAYGKSEVWAKDFVGTALGMAATPIRDVLRAGRMG